MNLSTLTLAQLKATADKYALQVDGDKRLRSTWENAIESAGEFIAAQVDAVKDAAIETFTYDNAVIAANTLNAVTRGVVKFTLKAFIVSCLLAIALGMSAADTWHQFKEWLEGQDLTPSQPVAVIKLITSKVRKRINRFSVHCYDRLQDWIEAQTIKAWYAVDENAIQPAQEFRDRINAARLASIRAWKS